MEIQGVIFDFDGVVRHFDADFVPALERRYGLPEGAIHYAAFSQPLLTELTTGGLARREWARRVGELIGSPEAAEEWAHSPTSADREVLALVDELRAKGRTVAVLTNGTDESRAEAAELGVLEHFDAFFNSADIGYAKPDPRVFKYVLTQLSLEGPEVFFTDDSASNLPGAEELGMLTQHFISVTDLRVALQQVGILI